MFRDRFSCFLLCAKSFFIITLFFLALCVSPVLGIAQNITPYPTVYGISNTVKISKTPTPISRLKVDVQRIVDVHLEAITDDRIIFSDNTGFDDNKRFFIWEPDNNKLFDTNEDGIPGSVRLPDDGKYMVFLFDEADEGIDIDGDKKAYNTIMRFYHFETGQKLNLGIPARSATPPPGESRSIFEYSLKKNFLAFSVSDANDNTSRDEDAPWHVINMLDIVYEIEGTPTPTPTFTPVIVGPPTPTPIPPTPTPIPTIDPGLQSSADINADGSVNQLDLLLFQYFWNK